jgi:hypothetical protein
LEKLLTIFQDDIQLVFRNAMLYNKSDSGYGKAAQRIEKVASEELRKLYQEMNVPFPAESEGTGVSEPPLLNGTATFQPPDDVLGLLSSKTTLSEATNLIFTADPITSLFAQEHAQFQPLPSPPAHPPPPPTLSAKKSKISKKKKLAVPRDYAKERERAKELRALRQAEAQEQLELDQGPGFRAPRTTRRGAVGGPEPISATPSAELISATTPPRPDPSIIVPPVSATTIKKPPVHDPLMTTTTLPPVISAEDFGKRDTFRTFETGHILPEGTKRGNRAALRESPLPPKKRQKFGSPRAGSGTPQQGEEDGHPERSRLSSATPAIVDETFDVSTDAPSPAESDLTVLSSFDEDERVAETLFPVESSEPAGLAGNQASPVSPVEMSLGTEDTTAEKPIMPTDGKSTSEGVPRPTGLFVIETVETPATRREANRLRKAARANPPDGGNDAGQPPSLKITRAQYEHGTLGMEYFCCCRFIF